MELGVGFVPIRKPGKLPAETVEISYQKEYGVDTIQIHIPANFDYQNLQSLSTEARQKLTKIQPATIGEASRIPGVSPNDISVLLVFMGR